MSFSDNLKQMRKEKGLSQEALAELLEVSRQAVSKWELGEGYPEVEKLLLLSQRLKVSLDELLDTGLSSAKREAWGGVSGEILISSPNENVIAKCIKLLSSQEFKGGKDTPKYALYGVSGTSMLGENSTFLGWYADFESISREMSEINSAIKANAASYELKYSVKTKTHWGSVKIL